jgi:hypothetical protein
LKIKQESKKKKYCQKYIAEKAICLIPKPTSYAPVYKMGNASWVQNYLIQRSQSNDQQLDLTTKKTF